MPALGQHCCASPGEAQLMSVLACSWGASLRAAAVPEACGARELPLRGWSESWEHAGTAAKSLCWEGDALASRGCPPSAAFAAPCLFSAADQLAYTVQDLSGCCGWYLFHFQDVVVISAADNTIGPVEMASSVSVPNI